jgi:hypothetical protein
VRLSTQTSRTPAKNVLASLLQRVARCDGTEMFQGAQESLYEVALSIECEVGRALVLPIGLGRDYLCNFAGFEVFDQGVGIVSLVGDQGVGFKSKQA